MKCFFAICLVVIGIVSQAQVNDLLAHTIDSLYETDQAVQWQLKALLEAHVSADRIRQQDSIKKQTYQRAIPFIRQVYAQYGYPTVALVGEQAAHHFFVLIQHADSDPALQESLLPVLEKLSREGLVSAKDYAYLYDRVQRNIGGMQLYGTQLSYDSRGNLFDSCNRIIYPPDLADPARVDERRKTVGLGPIEAYYESVLEMLGRPRKKP